MLYFVLNLVAFASLLPKKFLFVWNIKLKCRRRFWHQFVLSLRKSRDFIIVMIKNNDRFKWNYTPTYLVEPPRDKTNKVSVRPAKTQISLGIRPVWSESSLCAQWVAKDSSFLHADSEDSDQTRRMHRLIWVFAGRTTTLLVLSWGGSVCFSIIFTENKLSKLVLKKAHTI